MPGRATRSQGPAGASCDLPTGVTVDIIAADDGSAGLATSLPGHEWCPDRHGLLAGMDGRRPTQLDRRRAARRGGRGGAGPRGRPRRQLRRHPHQPLPPRIDRDARAPGAERLAVDQLRPRPARAGQRRLGLRRHQPRRARRRRAPPRSRRSPSPAPTPRWRRARSCSPTPTRSSTTWTSAFKRDPFEVPLDTKIAFLMKLNETALAVPGRHASSARRCCSSTSRSTSPRAKARASRSGWCAPIRSSAPPPPIAPAATSRPAPSSIARSWSATSTSRTTRGCRTPRRPATKWSRS